MRYRTFGVRAQGVEDVTAVIAAAERLGCRMRWRQKGLRLAQVEDVTVNE